MGEMLSLEPEADSVKQQKSDDLQDGKEVAWGIAERAAAALPSTNCSC